MFVSDRVASPLRSSYVQVASLDTPSPYTVVAHLRKPSFGVISQIFVAGSGFIVPEHILRGVNDIRRSSFNASPVGTGPFAVTRWDRGDDIHLVANDRYFEGRPRVQGLLLRIVPDPVTRAQLATTGAVELASVDQSEVSSLKAVPGIRVVRTLARSVFYLDLNTRRSPLDKRALRRALAAAVDRPRLASILGGGVQAANSLMPGDRRCTKVAGPAEAIRSRGGGPLLVQLTLRRARRWNTWRWYSGRRGKASGSRRRCALYLLRFCTARAARLQRAGTTWLSTASASPLLGASRRSLQTKAYRPRGSTFHVRRSRCRSLACHGRWYRRRAEACTVICARARCALP